MVLNRFLSVGRREGSWEVARFSPNDVNKDESTCCTKARSYRITQSDGHNPISPLEVGEASRM